MKTKMKPETTESTYALLVRSANEDRSLPESAVYLLLILCTVFSVWQSAHQRFELPSFGLIQSAPIAAVATERVPGA